MKPKFIQVNCVEGNVVDLRQAKAVLRHKPDFIFLEYPGDSMKPIVKSLRQPKNVVLRHPWIKSDNYMWANIARLWRDGRRNVFVYAVDGPTDIVITANIYPFNKKHPHKTTNIFWWIRVYLRECFMAENINRILRQHKSEKNSVILVFLQSFHWRHVKFLLKKPPKRKIWNFYFGKFKKLTMAEIEKKLAGENKILLKNWHNPVNGLL